MTITPIATQPNGTYWCGYLIFDRPADATEQRLMDELFHGGITYEHQEFDVNEKPCWVYGFDCNHAGDMDEYLLDLMNLPPKVKELMLPIATGTYKTEEYVRACLDSTIEYLLRYRDTIS